MTAQTPEEKVKKLKKNLIIFWESNEENDFTVGMFLIEQSLTLLREIEYDIALQKIQEKQPVDSIDLSR
jgi:hypothetical protein